MESAQIDNTESFNFFQPKATVFDCLTLSLSVICWWCIQRIVFYFTKEPEKMTKLKDEPHYCGEKLNYLNSYVTLIHNWFGIIIGSIYAYNYPLNTCQPCTNFELFITNVSLGYFIYDGITGIYYQTDPPIMLLHHLFSIFGFGTPWLWKRFGSESVIGLLIAEITGPFLTYRKIAPYIWEKNQVIINDAIFMSLFIYVRVKYLEWLFFHIHLSDAPIFFKLQA